MSPSDEPQAEKVKIFTPRDHLTPLRFVLANIADPVVDFHVS